MTPDLRTVRNRLAALRTVVAGNPFRNQWLALALLEGIDTALGEEEPVPPTEDQIEAGRLGDLIPFPRGPSSMTRDLLLEET